MQEIESKPTGILFVCTGNICRSPMAAALFGNGKANGTHVVRSAGIRAADGQAAHPLAQAYMYSRGLDLSDHRARTVTPNLLAAFGLILVMEREHQAWIEANMTSVRGRVHLLGHWKNHEIPDPVNGLRSDFERVADEIEQCLLDWSRYLEQRAELVQTPAVRSLP